MNTTKIQRRNEQDIQDKISRNYYRCKQINYHLSNSNNTDIPPVLHEKKSVPKGTNKQLCAMFSDEAEFK